MTPAGHVSAYGTANGVPSSAVDSLSAGPNGLRWFGDDAFDLGSITTGGTVQLVTSVKVPDGCNYRDGTSVARRRGSISGSCSMNASTPSGTVNSARARRPMSRARSIRKART